MATPKNVTINDVDMGVLYIYPLESGNLTIRRNYTLTGTDQPLLNAAGTFVLERTIVFANLPQDIRDALTAINNWTYSEILEDQGME